jgi:hypothetical protein
MPEVEAQLNMYFPWPPLEAPLSSFSVLFLVDTFLTIRRYPKDNNQHQALSSTIFNVCEV